MSPKKPDKPEISDEAIYAAVAARRAGFDNMLWQVPIISFTAQAFLLTIALGPNTQPTARYISAGLAILVTLLSMILMARHRQADIADSAWLENLEQERGRDRKLQMHAHGQPWRRRRNATDLTRFTYTPLNWMKTWGAFFIWEMGLLIFGLAAASIIVLTLVAPELL